MISKQLLFLFLLFTASGISAQSDYISSISYPDRSQKMLSVKNSFEARMASSITRQELRRHVFTLADDAMEGRETGEPGIDKAARYISDQFKNLELQSLKGENYFQPIEFTFHSWQDIQLVIDSQEIQHLGDYLSFPNINSTIKKRYDEILFLGYGIEDDRYSDYTNVNNLEGKAIMIYEGEPIDKNKKSVITKDTLLSQEWGTSVIKKLETAKKYGVDLVFIVSNNLYELVNTNRKIILNRMTELGTPLVERRNMANSIYVSSAKARELIGSNLSKVIEYREKSQLAIGFQPIHLAVNISINQNVLRKKITGNNVAGFIEGSSKKNELIVLTAHYDHIGKKGSSIFNGADDNATGTSSVIEIAEALAISKKLNRGPKRSILCLLVEGEEKGLLGSQYYSENPLLPLSSTVANVNIDMIGRRDKEHTDNPNYIYVIGSDRLSSDLHEINEEMNQKYSQLVLDYTYNSESDPNRYYYRSDHYNFARKGIPSIFYFSGVHEDYHQPTDTADKIEYERLEKISRHIFHTVWELANRDERISVDRN